MAISVFPRWQLARVPVFGFLAGICVLWPSGCAHRSYSESRLEPLLEVSRAPASVQLQSGYLLTGAECGSGELAYPRLMLGMRQGFCAGLVASKDDGLVFPRNIVQIPGSPHFVVTDMGGWGANLGKVWLLEKLPGRKHRPRLLLDKLDGPHGLSIGPDRKVYVGTTSEIFRFDPLAAKSHETIETIVRGLPGRTPVLSDGTKLKSNNHPLKQFIFDAKGNLYVNIGAPTDNCGEDGERGKACAAAAGDRAMAAIWKYAVPTSGVFSKLKAGEPGPAPEVFASGLRNSMALAVHPRYPEPGYAFLQAENARDLPDPDRPNDELNAIEKGRFYGWPYCFDESSTSPEFAATVAKDPRLRGLCQNPGAHQKPHSLLPPHVAPLGLLYYQGARFPELGGSVVMTWHGYMAGGSRVVTYATDGKGFPLRADAPLKYRVNCAPEPELAVKTESHAAVTGSQAEELIGGWFKVNGIRPQGAPVGVTVADDGAIWIVEDKNQTILRIDRDTDLAAAQAAEGLGCDTRSEAEIHRLLGFIDANSRNRARLARLRSSFFEHRCSACHSGFGITPELSGDQRDLAVAKFILSQDGWITPGDPDASRVSLRVRGRVAGQAMPPDGIRPEERGPEYLELLNELDRFIEELVPGERRRVKLERAPSLKVRDRNKAICGAIDAGAIVVVQDARPSEMPGFVRIYRPADKYLNGTCTQDSEFYIGEAYAMPLAAALRPGREIAAATSEEGAETESLFVSRELTKPGLFSSAVEGPAVDLDGTVYAVNFGSRGTIGRVLPDGAASKWLELPKGSIGNALRFVAQGRMLAADYKGHKIYSIDVASKKVSIFLSEPKMTQPNDFTALKDGSLFVSDPDFKARKGRIWFVSKDGRPQVVFEGLANANGIDVSPDEKTLYVSDSVTQAVWAFEISGHSLAKKRLFRQFLEKSVDGLRTDADGNIYVARIERGVIAKLSPKGELLKEILTKGKLPSNLAFGGADGRTVYVTEMGKGLIETFRVDVPGREFKLLRENISK